MLVRNLPVLAVFVLLILAGNQIYPNSDDVFYWLPAASLAQGTGLGVPLSDHNFPLLFNFPFLSLVTSPGQWFNLLIQDGVPNNWSAGLYRWPVLLIFILALAISIKFVLRQTQGHYAALWVFLLALAFSPVAMLYPLYRPESLGLLCLLSAAWLLFDPNNNVKNAPFKNLFGGLLLGCSFAAHPVFAPYVGLTGLLRLGLGIQHRESLGLLFFVIGAALPLIALSFWFADHWDWAVWQLASQQKAATSFPWLRLFKFWGEMALGGEEENSRLAKLVLSFYFGPGLVSFVLCCACVVGGFWLARVRRSWLSQPSTILALLWFGANLVITACLYPTAYFLSLVGWINALVLALLLPVGRLVMVPEPLRLKPVIWAFFGLVMLILPLVHFVKFQMFPDQYLSPAGLQAAVVPAMEGKEKLVIDSHVTAPLFAKMLTPGANAQATAIYATPLRGVVYASPSSIEKQEQILDDFLMHPRPDRLLWLLHLGSISDLKDGRICYSLPHLTAPIGFQLDHIYFRGNGVILLSASSVSRNCD